MTSSQKSEESEQKPPFTVQISTKAKKNLAALDSQTFEAVQDALLEMEIDPYAGDHKKLAGNQGHRRRVGRYRILYDIDTDLRLVSVFDVIHRSKAYRKF